MDAVRVANSVVLTAVDRVGWKDVSLVHRKVELKGYQQAALKVYMKV